MDTSIKFNNLNNNVYFDGIGGEWTLIDSLQLGNSITNQNCIYFVNGNLNTNSQNVDCFSFYSTQSTPRKLTLENSEIRVQNYWYVYGNNLTLDENQSVIQVDSGRFIHNLGNYCPYHVVNFNHPFVNQELICRLVDSVFFDTITFHNPNCKMYGYSGTVYGHDVRFEGIGQINDPIDAVPNIYIIDSLYFNSTGTIYGNDTIRNFVNFNST